MADGFASVEEYAQAVLRATAAPSFLDRGIEEVLLKRIADPRAGTKFDQQFRQKFQADVQRRRQARR